MGAFARLRGFRARPKPPAKVPKLPRRGRDYRRSKLFTTRPLLIVSSPTRRRSSAAIMIRRFLSHVALFDASSRELFQRDIRRVYCPSIDIVRNTPRNTRALRKPVQQRDITQVKSPRLRGLDGLNHRTERNRRFGGDNLRPSRIFSAVSRRCAKTRSAARLGLQLLQQYAHVKMIFLCLFIRFQRCVHAKTRSPYLFMKTKTRRLPPGEFPLCPDLSLPPPAIRAAASKIEPVQITAFQPRLVPRVHGSFRGTKVHAADTRPPRLSCVMLAIHGDRPQESITDVPPHKVIKDLRNYCYYTEPRAIIRPRSGDTRISTHTHTHVQADRCCCKETIVNVRRYAPSSRFRFRRRDRNAYIPRVREREGERERGVKASEPERGGRGRRAHGRVDTGNRIDSGLAHVRPRVHRHDTCAYGSHVCVCVYVCTRDRLIVCAHTLCGGATMRVSLDQGRSLFTPTGST